MFKFNIINKILKKSNSIFLCFLFFKLFLLFFYIIGGYQAFTVTTTKLILRIIISNEVFLLFFSIMNIITNRSIKRKNYLSILVIVLSIISIFFAPITFLFVFFVIVFS